MRSSPHRIAPGVSVPATSVRVLEAGVTDVTTLAVDFQILLEGRNIGGVGDETHPIGEHEIEPIGDVEPLFAGRLDSGSCRLAGAKY